MEKKVDIDKRGHALDILEQLNNFRKNNKHCDFIIKAGKEERPVHRYVVSACSEYFDAMLTHDTKENRDGVVEIKNVDSECVMKCVDFMYTGEASVSDEKQGDLMHVAHMLRLHRLYNGVALFLEKKLDCQSFFSTREIANTYDCKKLTEVCNEFALKNFRKLVQLEDFKTLEDDYLTFLLASKGLKETEWVKCKAVMVWVNHDSSRASSIFSIIKCIDFMNIPMSYRRFLVDNEPSISSSNECLKYVMKSMFDGDNVKAKDVSLDAKLGIIVFDSSSNKLKRLDIESKTWSEKQTTQILGNQTHSAVVLDDFLYAILTNRATYRIKFGNDNATWEQMANYNGNYGLAIVLNGLIYKTDHHTYNYQLERFDSSSNQWSFIPNRVRDVCFSALAVLEGKLFVIGGFERRGYSVNYVERFDPVASTWSNSACLNQIRHYASATTLENTIYVLGPVYCDIGIFSLSKSCYNMPSQFVVFVEGNDQYIVLILAGGSSQTSERVPSLEIFKQDTNSWELVNMSNPTCHSFNTIPFDGMLYLVGGYSSDPRSIYQYDPHAKKLSKILNFGFDINEYASVAVTC